MPNYAALLRAVNVTGRNRIAMAALRDAFVDLGHSDVATYVQSGNVVFRTSIADPVRIAGAIRGRIRDAFGIDVAVLLRSHAQLASVLSSNPFRTKGADTAALYVTFLDAKPAAALVRSLGTGSVGPDRFAVVGREVFVHCPGGYGRTKLNLTYFEKRLAMAATTRNWNTLDALVKMTAS